MPPQHPYTTNRHQAAPETGHHTVPDTLRDEALGLFFATKVETAPTSGGVNNVCQVGSPEGSRACAVTCGSGMQRSAAVVYYVCSRCGLRMSTPTGPRPSCLAPPAVRHHP
jgi:hypothetical protein